MYDELIKRLREQVKCDKKTYPQGAPFETLLLDLAADAIEFLQTYKVALENIVSMGGWWLVGQDKNLYRMNVPMNWPPKGTKTVEVFPLPTPPTAEEDER